ncbi:MAG: hypothetical protein WCT14_11720 [Treponemataceae bacterium]
MKEKMKSSEEDLKRRGRLSDKEYLLISTTIEKNIVAYLDSEEGYLRSAALRFIKIRKDETFLPRLYAMLSQENPIYTRIELGDCLLEFGEQVLENIMPLLGRIGNNQHKEIGNYDLGKKSFPLPRDVVGRIAIRFGPIVFKYLDTAFIERDVSVLSEAIDIIGHVTYAYKDYSMENKLIEEYSKVNNLLIEWKLIKAFQSFNSEEVIGKLETIICDERKDIILRREAERSLLRIKERNPRIALSVLCTRTDM